MKTVYFEFYGLPGCGKSTISHELANHLREKNTVFEPSYEIDHKLSSKYRKIIKTLKAILMVFLHPICFFRVLSIVSSNVSTLRDLVAQIINIAYKLLIYKGKHSCEYVIFDEGLIQSIISLKACKKRDKNRAEINCLFDCFRGKVIVPIYVYTPIKDVLIRMDKRKKHEASVEKMHNDSEKIAYLDKTRKICDGVMLSNAITIDGEQPIEKSVMYILDKINNDFLPG